jgi:iron complex transport system permease protein
LCVGLLLHAVLACLPVDAWPSVLFETDRLSMDEIIVFFGLLPRAATAVLAGAALGLSGALLQLLLRNPVADPSTLGISAGAQLAIVAATLFFPSILDEYRSLVALGGAASAAAMVFALGWRRSFEPVTMVVSGMLIGVTAAAMSAALTLSQGEYLMSLLTWNGGSLSQQDWSVSRMLAIELAAGLLLAGILVRPLTVLSLGDASAKSFGVSLRSMRLGVAGLAVALAGVVAAAVGLVSFVGLAAPALARTLGVRRPVELVFASAASGGLLLWLCDGLVQLVASTTSESFPTGAMTGLIGGPLLLWLLPRVRSAEITRNGGATIQQRRSGRYLFPLLAILVFAVGLALCLGRTAEGWTILNAEQLRDLWPLRWPRLLAVSAAGGLLALTGSTLQRLTGNPVASPEVIGVSGGAGLGFAFAISIVPAAGAFELFLGSGLGALLVMAIVLLFASRRDLPPDRLLLAGIAMSSLCASVLAVLMAIGDQRSWQILAWLGGSGSTATPISATFLAVVAVLVLSVSLTFERWLTILPLGRLVPQSLGLPLRLSRVVMILVCGLATGTASMLVGPLSFVGLVAPHIATWSGFVRARHQLVASFLLGAILMTLADLGARTATFPYDLPLGLFAALVGAPYLIVLISRK